MQKTKLHVAIIMDGNGRWAKARNEPRTEGHRAGAEAVRRTVEAAPRLDIGTLTLHAFSSDNWKRPAREVGVLMGLFRQYLAAESAHCAERGIRLSVIGRRDRLHPALGHAIEAAEAATARGTELHLRIAVDYSARDSVFQAAQMLAGRRQVSRELFSRALARAIHADEETPDVDLLIRTGGESRLSDLLGWDSAYAELVFTPKMWPEFEAADLRAAVEEFWRRERRFGGLPGSARDPALQATKQAGGLVAGERAPVSLQSFSTRICEGDALAADSNRFEGARDTQERLAPFTQGEIPTS